MARLAVLLAAAVVLAGCALLEEIETREGATEIPGVVLAEPQEWPQHLRGEWSDASGGIAIAQDEDELVELWESLGEDDPPTRFLDTSVIIAAGILEGGLCPLRVLAVDARLGNDIGFHLHNPRMTGETDCGREFIPRTFVVAVPISALEDGDVELTLLRPDDREETRTAGFSVDG
jgi:hypothetical protein